MVVRKRGEEEFYQPIPGVGYAENRPPYSFVNARNLRPGMPPLSFDFEAVLGAITELYTEEIRNNMIL